MTDSSLRPARYDNFYRQNRQNDRIDKPNRLTEADRIDKPNRLTEADKIDIPNRLLGADRIDKIDIPNRLTEADRIDKPNRPLEGSTACRMAPLCRGCQPVVVGGGWRQPSRPQ